MDSRTEVLANGKRGDIYREARALLAEGDSKTDALLVGLAFGVTEGLKAARTIHLEAVEELDELLEEGSRILGLLGG